MSRIQIDIDHGDLDDKAASDLGKLAQKSVEAAVSCAQLKFPADAELSILLADDHRLQSLNREWRGIDKATNVLSFPGEEISVGEMAGPLLGDIAVSMETLSREAGLENKKLNDHFCHLIVHGFLHLFGYDHETDEEADAMENLERVILAELGIADPYESDI